MTQRSTDEETGSVGTDWHSRPMLVVVCGLPGVGKTTVARAVVDRIDAVHVRTDEVRKDILEDPQYSDEEKRRVYDAVFDRAREGLDSGPPVVVDGTFSKPVYRETSLDLAADLGVPYHLLKVECDPDVVEERIREREEGYSDADFTVHQEYRDEFVPVEFEHEVIDNSRNERATVEQVADVLRAEPYRPGAT